jgi:hypothetical protein
MKKQTSKIDKLLNELATQLRILRRRWQSAIDRVDAKHRKTLAALNEQHDSAESDWWATIPKDMQPLVEDAFGKLEQINETEPKS